MIKRRPDLVASNVGDIDPVALRARLTAHLYDVYCLGDSVLHYRVDGGNWGTMAYNLGLAPPVPCELDIDRTVNDLVSLDWVRVFVAK